MRIGVPKEIKTLEDRVGLIPEVVKGLTRRGHEVAVETGAGAGMGARTEFARSPLEVLKGAVKKAVAKKKAKKSKR